MKGALPAAGLLLLLISVTSLAAPRELAPVEVRVHARVRGDEAPDPSVPLPGTVRLLVDALADPSWATFDPAVEPFRLDLGGVVLGGPEMPLRGDASRRGTTVRWRAAGPGGVASFRLHTASGILAVRARRTDVRALLGADPAAVPMTLTLGAVSRTTTFALDSTGPASWLYTPAPPPPHPRGYNEPFWVQRTPWPTWSGDNSAIATPFRTVARTEDEWRSIWARHSPGTAAPTVDFSKDMVVCVFAGWVQGYEWFLWMPEVRQRVSGVLVVSDLSVVTVPCPPRTTPRSGNAYFLLVVPFVAGVDEFQHTTGPYPGCPSPH